MKVCPGCGALYDGHRWIPEPDDDQVRRFCKAKLENQLCVGCLRIEKRQVEGVVTIRGSFIGAHRMEVRSIVNRVASKGRHRNVAARILEVTEQKEGMVIETTDHSLAERIGKELEKAFKGNLEIKWQAKDRFVRVAWQR